MLDLGRPRRNLNLEEFITLLESINADRELNANMMMHRREEARVPRRDVPSMHKLHWFLQVSKAEETLEEERDRPVSILLLPGPGISCGRSAAKATPAPMQDSGNASLQTTQVSSYENHIVCGLVYSFPQSFGFRTIRVMAYRTAICYRISNECAMLLGQTHCALKPNTHIDLLTRRQTSKICGRAR